MLVDVLLAIAGSEDNVFIVDYFEDLEGGFHHEVLSSQVCTTHIKLRHHRTTFQVVLNEINSSQSNNPMDHIYFGRDQSHVAVWLTCFGHDQSHVVRFVESSVRKKDPPPRTSSTQKYTILVCV